MAPYLIFLVFLMPELLESVVQVRITVFITKKKYLSLVTVV